MTMLEPFCLSRPWQIFLCSAVLTAAALPAAAFDRDFKASLRSSKGDSYVAFMELGINRYVWDKPDAILDDDRAALTGLVPDGMFSGSTEDSGTGLSLRVGGELDLSPRFPSGNSTFWGGWWLEVGSLPGFTVDERFDFKVPANGQDEQRRITGNLELDGKLTYGVGVTARWEWGNTVKYSAGPYLSYDWYQIDRDARSTLSIERSGVFEAVDEFAESGDVDDSALGYGVAVGVRFGDGPGRQPWYFRALYGVNEVDEFDLRRFSLSVSRTFGGYGHHVEGP